MIEQWVEFGLDMSARLQAAFPQLLEPMQAISDFGRIEAYLLIIAILYWCIDKRSGAQLAYLLALTGFLNLAAKQIGRQPRPFWLDSDLAVSNAEGYGFPSGHVQMATVFAYFFVAWLRDYWIGILATLYIATMALSRVYLGVHFVHDVIAGFLFGALTILFFVLAQQAVGARFNQRILGQRLLVMSIVPAVLLATWAIAIAYLGAPEVPAGWQSLADSAETHLTAGVVAAAASLFGLGVGIALERSRVRFQTDGPITQRLLRLVVGLAITAIMLYGLDILLTAVTATLPSWLTLPIQFVLFTLLGLWVTYYAPSLFVGLKLARFSAEPELPYSIQATPLRFPRER